MSLSKVTIVKNVR